VVTGVCVRMSVWLYAFCFLKFNGHCTIHKTIYNSNYYTGLNDPGPIHPALIIIATRLIVLGNIN